MTGWDSNKNGTPNDGVPFLFVGFRLLLFACFSQRVESTGTAAVVAPSDCLLQTSIVAVHCSEREAEEIVFRAIADGEVLMVRVTAVTLVVLSHEVLLIPCLELLLLCGKRLTQVYRLTAADTSLDEGRSRR